MRIIVYGLGAVGGLIAASLVLEDREVIGIGRGRMLKAIQANNGLKIISSRGHETIAIPCVAHPNEIDWRADDVIVLTMKANDIQAALETLRTSGVYEQSIICAQNGVANERMALRIFPNVFGAVVMMSSEHIEPGIVIANCAPKFGLLEVGKYPTGMDETTKAICAAIDTPTFGCDPVANSMDGKYGKLLMNIGSAAAAALGPQARKSQWYDRARKEAEAAYKAAGIAHYTVEFGDPRRDLIKRVPLEGVIRTGSSTVQSLVRNTGSIESDYLNGEIVLLGRLHNVATPVNAALVRATEKMVKQNMQPGTFPEDELARLVAQG